MFLIKFCLCCPACGEPVGLLLLHLSWVPGPEGGVPRNVGRDHQRPDTKGGVRPHSHDLLPQEVTHLTDGTEAALRTERGEEVREWKRKCACKAWPVGLHPVAQFASILLLNGKDKWCGDRREKGGKDFDPAITTSGSQLWIVGRAEHDTPRVTCDKCDKASWSFPCGALPAPKTITVFSMEIKPYIS